MDQARGHDPGQLPIKVHPDGTWTRTGNGSPELQAGPAAEGPPKFIKWLQIPVQLSLFALKPGSLKDTSGWKGLDGRQHRPVLLMDRAYAGIQDAPVGHCPSVLIRTLCQCQHNPGYLCSSHISSRLQGIGESRMLMPAAASRNRHGPPPRGGYGCIRHKDRSHWLLSGQAADHPH